MNVKFLALMLGLTLGFSSSVSAMEIDPDGDKAVSLEELLSLTQSMGLNLTASEAKLVIEMGDKNGNGKLDGDELQALSRLAAPISMGEDPYQAAFNRMDLDKDQTISWAELASFSQLNQQSSSVKKQALKEFKQADTDRNGRIDRTEYLQMMGQ